ncbi:hypothetical protein [Actinomadura gamaensis]|uniref:TrbL/VirB6 plasmid conjugal transfer protein n=1 Tax=Actinomadura gamaensis TaxID=1763541 RepID=A0ABV9U8P3_9ACTN
MTGPTGALARGVRRSARNRLLPMLAAVLALLAVLAGPAAASTFLPAAPPTSLAGRPASGPGHAPAPPVSPSGSPVPLPSHAPWIQAPGGQPGAPVIPGQPIPAPGTVPGPGTCQGKVKTAPWGSPKPFLCEVAPGKWVPVTQTEIDHPDDSAPSKRGIDHSAEDHCDMWDVPCQVRGAVTAWFGGLVSSAIGPTFTFLGATVFATPSLNSPSMDRARQLWSTSQWIANTCFVLLITAAGVLLITGTSLPREFSVREVLPRLVWAFLAVNLSLTVIGYGIDFANGLANAFLQAGGQHIEIHQAAEVMARTLESAAKSTSSFITIIALIAVILAGCVAFSYVIRLAVTIALIAAAPVALMFHALPLTQGLAVLWWRGITGMLAIQVCQSLVFVTALEILLSLDPDRPRNDTFFTLPTNRQDFMDLLLIIALMWVLMRIPFWVARTIWNQAQPRALNNMLKTFVLYRALGSFTSPRGSRGRRTSDRPAPTSGSTAPKPTAKPTQPAAKGWRAQPQQVPVPAPPGPSAPPPLKWPTVQTPPPTPAGTTGGTGAGNGRPTGSAPPPPRPYRPFALPAQRGLPAHVPAAFGPASAALPARPYRPLPPPQARAHTWPVPPRPFPVWVEHPRTTGPRTTSPTSPRPQQPRPHNPGPRDPGPRDPGPRDSGRS